MVDQGTTEVGGLASPKWRIASVDRTTLASAGSVLAAVGASACCVVPFVLLSFGVTGAVLVAFGLWSLYFGLFVRLEDWV